MKKFLESKLVTTILIIVVLFFLVKWGVDKYLNLKADYAISQQNASALNDSLRVAKNKFGDLEYSKQILVAKNAKDLKDLNSEMAKIVKGFKGDIHELTSLVADITGDSIFIDNTSLVDLPENVSGFKWNYHEVYDADNSRTLEGLTKFKYDSLTNFIEPLETIITKDKIRFNLTQGLRTTEDDKVEMFASSKYPGFSAIDLNSVIIDPSTHPTLEKFTKQKRFGLGVYVGVGPTVNLSDFTVIVGPQVGVGATYRVW